MVQKRSTRTQFWKIKWLGKKDHTEGTRDDMKRLHDRSMMTLFCMGLVLGAISDLAFGEKRSADQVGNIEVKPPHVLARVTLLRAELERLRFYMGKPVDNRPELVVRNAAPREVFFQAMTLFKKANRLAFEITSETIAAPTPPNVMIQPAHVLSVVSTALERIRRIQNRLSMTTQLSEPPPDHTKTPTDVFQAIVHANRQLNILLSQKFSPSDVYQRVSLALSYAFRLRGQFSHARMPETPVFDAGKRPADVYRELLECFQLIQTIGQTSQIKMLDLTVNAAEIDHAEPSDVYDIASLLVSELTYLHRQVANAPPPYKVYPPELKFPAHVYQRAGLLKRLLMELQTMVERNPMWLKNQTIVSP